MDLIFLQCITQNKDGPYISTVYYTKQRENSSDFRTSIERSVQSEGSIEVCETVEELPSTIKRMDSLMSQDFYTTLYTSWEGSNRFAEFRRKFGEALRHKYFSYCRFDDTVFIGIFVVYGMFLVCAGTYNYLSCRSDILTNIYFITDGVLSVFVFPVLVMSWKVRVGGCVNESAKVGPGTVWYSVLVARIMSSSLGKYIETN
ncbi:uncharacterized protein LOC127733344 [Mytilus californianus]|uniref:uncharacterized protein LOC127733344 n=1 Tax=Mytilus californianus TaxID=6549 RepID=UPI002246D51D|nr:uncharacterized protein LOC127733344 [Mytilus californianus]